jgi:hypothetical protein
MALRARLDEVLRAADQQTAEDWPLAALGFLQEGQRTLDELRALIEQEAERWRRRTAFCARCGHPRFGFIRHEPLCVAHYDAASASNHPHQENVH